MEWDSSVKRLDFDDVSLTIPSSEVAPGGEAQGDPPPQPSEGNDTLEISGAPPTDVDGSVGSGLPDDASIALLREEAHRIRESLAPVYAFVSDFSDTFQQKVKAEPAGYDSSVKQWKKLFSTLADEYVELTVKEEVIQRLEDWKMGDGKNDEEKSLDNDSAVDSDTMGDELTALKNANSQTILEIESLIRTIASDVNGLETDLSDASVCLDAFDVEVDKRAKEENALVCRAGDTNEQLSGYKQSENIQDLESTIRHLEEALRQNEKEYIEAEAAMESRIEQYNLEIEELQAQASQLEKEEECMRLLIDVSSRSLQSQKHMECSSNVSVISMGNESIELRLTNFALNVEDPKDVPDQWSNPIWEHNLQIKINQETMQIEEAKLTPESVSIDDLLSAARAKRAVTASLASMKEGALGNFGPQLAFLVRAVHQRLTIHAFKLASMRNAASNPTYSVEHKWESAEMTIVKPGQLKAVLEIPDNWPTQGFSPRLHSLKLLDPHSTDEGTDDTMQMAVELANQLPESIRHDLHTFMQAIERITRE